jgi:superfamily II DNA or RNA helicase
VSSEAHRRAAEHLLRDYRGQQPEDRRPTDGQVVEQSRRAAQLLARLNAPGSSVVLGDPVGTGKTEVTLAAAGVALTKGRSAAPLRCVLVVTPNDVVRKIWTLRALEMLREPVTAGLVRVMDSVPPGKQAVPFVVACTRKHLPVRLSGPKGGWLLVVDEAHRGAESTAETGFYERLAGIAAGERAVLVTATPFQISGRGFRKLFTVTGRPEPARIQSFAEASASTSQRSRPFTRWPARPG